MQRETPKKNWALTSSAFNRLLEWFDQGENSEGQNYLAIRRRLVAYFDRKNCLLPDDLADETLNRVARRLEEEKEIKSETPAKYCYVTARFVFLEYLRRADGNSVSLDSNVQPNHQPPAATAEPDERQLKEKMLDCLENCLTQLEPTEHEIIVNYYYGTERIKIENRRELAERLEISSNALSIRACRIRGKLEICVAQCVAEE